VITPRRTRLLRVAGLHDFRRAISALRTPSLASPSGSRLTLVPTQGAAHQLRRTLEQGRPALSPEATADLVTRDQCYERLHARLPQSPRRLTPFEREAMAQAAALEASTPPGPALPFQLRPGLVAEMLRFYDQLRRQSQQAGRFDAMIEEAVGAAVPADVGAERTLQQTRFLARAFRAYERRVLEAEACDEHALRDRLMADAGVPPVQHVIVTMPDWIADPDGLFVADFDLLARMPGLERVDIVCTDAVLGSGFHQRLHDWWPGLEEAAGADILDAVPRGQPVLLTPPGAGLEQLWFTVRDREEELRTIVDRLERDGAVTFDRQAVVYRRPLPYLYLAPETFGAAAIPYQTSDALPLAAEPTAAAVDLVLDLVETDFARDSIVGLLRSPHFRCEGDARTLTREGVSALDRALSEARYLGDRSRLEELATRWAVPEALPALEVALAAVRELAPLAEPAPASRQIRRVLAFVTRHARPLEAGNPFEPRERRARAAIADVLGALALAREAHHDPVWTISDLAPAVRGWIEEQTFAPESSSTGVHLVDDRAARFGEFDDVAVVGLVEHEWPERPRRNIFYSPSLLKILGWPTEKDRRAAADARFLDLLASAARRVAVSTITLDDEALVVRSSQLGEIPRARLSAVPDDRDERPGMSELETIAGRGSRLGPPQGIGAAWAAIRSGRLPAASAEFHGRVGSLDARTWSVSALETYLGCPFKFFAQHILRLAEEPDDEEVMDPRRQGELLHDVFEAFFAEWQAAGRGAITPGNLQEARAVFTAVVDRVLAHLRDAEGGLERTRLLGSSAAAGLGEAVLRMEAERPVPVVERLLELRIDGTFSMATASGPRTVAVRGRADRLDLLADGTFRLIDYKLGWPPDRGHALQLPIYGLCAEQALTKERGRPWTLGEAAYLAFKGPKRVVPLFTPGSPREEVVADAQQRLTDTLDAIDRGDFPPTPDDVHRCDTCSFGSVCRRDYVGDV